MSNPIRIMSDLQNQSGSHLPEGTVTFLFTDIEGSTRLLQRLGSAYEQVLADHNRLIRAAIQQSGGVEVSTAGDSFFTVFPTAGQALEAAIDELEGRLDPLKNFILPGGTRVDCLLNPEDIEVSRESGAQPQRTVGASHAGAGDPVQLVQQLGRAEAEMLWRQPEASERLLTSFFDTGQADDSLFTHQPWEYNPGLGFPAIAKIIAGIILVLLALFIAVACRLNLRRKSVVQDQD